MFHKIHIHMDAGLCALHQDAVSMCDYQFSWKVFMKKINVDDSIYTHHFISLIGQLFKHNFHEKIASPCTSIFPCCSMHDLNCSRQDFYVYHGRLRTQRIVYPESTRILMDAPSAARTVSRTDCMRFWALPTSISVASWSSSEPTPHHHKTTIN